MDGQRLGIGMQIGIVHGPADIFLDGLFDDLLWVNVQNSAVSHSTRQSEQAGK